MRHSDEATPITELLDERRDLLALVRGMLGSGGELDSVVDETYRRWYELSGPVRAQIAAPGSWLTKVAGGICLARLALPVPGKVPAGRGIVWRAEAGPAEPVGPARRSLRRRRLEPTTPQQHDAVVRAVRQACAARDAVGLASLLACDVTAFFDGGGKIRALVEPVHGSDQVARTLLTLLSGHAPTTLRAQSVNGRSGLVVRYGHQVAAVIGLDVTGRHVVQVWVTLNPDKLRSWNPPGPAPRPCPGLRPYGQTSTS
ncbi:RNA polymerase subunit sigma [Streptomyces krungchingensis]|uniref:RNA polymerase subunit sigma n=1 Tax=Streptomyces krungchingensis TaxID=1565034 RepID=UPI003CEC60A4